MSDESATAPIITRPPHFPTMHTRETCKHLVAFGLTEAQICTIMKLMPSELRMHYMEEIEHGLARVNAQVQAALLHRALIDMDVPSMKLWLINKAGWRAGDKMGRDLDLPGDAPNGEQMTIVQRKTTIVEMLRVATQARLDEASVIEGEVVKKKPNGANGAGSNGTKHR